MRKAKSKRRVTKDRVVNVRMSSDDIIQMLKLSKSLNVSVSELIRQRTLNINPNKNK